MLFHWFKKIVFNIQWQIRIRVGLVAKCAFNHMKILLWHGKWLYYCCQVREWVTPLPLQSCLCNQGDQLWQSVILIVMGLLTIIYFRYFIPIRALHWHRISRIVINLSRVDCPGDDGEMGGSIISWLIKEM